MNEKQLLKYLKKSFFTGTFKTIVVMLSTIILLPLIIKEIGVEKYGLIVFTMIFGGLTVFADFGISKSVTLLIGKQKDDANKIISNALVINIIIISIIGCIFYLIAYLDVPILGDKLSITNDMKNHIILIGYFILVLMLINNLFMAILEAYFLVHYINIGAMLSSVLLYGSIYIFSILSTSLYLLLTAPLFSFLMISLYYFLIIKIHTNIKLARPTLGQIRKMLSISYKFMGIGLINSIVIPVNKILLVHVTGSGALLGIFDIGLKIAMIANSLLNSLTEPLFGVFSSRSKSIGEVYTLASRISIIVFVFYILGLVTFFFLGEYITLLVDADNFNEIYNISFILLIGVAFNAVSEPFYKAILGTQRLKEALLLKIMLPIFNVILYLGLEKNEYIFAISYSIAVFLNSLIIIVYFMIIHKKGVIK